MITPVLIPAPRKLRLFKSSFVLTRQKLAAIFKPRVVIDRAAMPHAQGYRLRIGPDGVVITAGDRAGAFYGRMTLRQLVRQARDGAVPCAEIVDWPDFAHRGVMLDISRDKVPSLDTLWSLIEKLAEWKINQVQLYTEHTFAYRGHKTVWEHASPLTAAEIRQIGRFCKARFIELVPNQNSFGHWERWLKHKRYAPLAECPDGFTYPWGAKLPHGSTLCPGDPRALKLLTQLYDQLLPNFTSRQVNIGGDEPWELGQGRSKADCQARGKGRVYLDFISKIHHEIRRRKRTMQFWGDIILLHPELIPQLPRDLIALNWGYEAGHPFAAECAKFAEAGVPFYVCPGTSSWMSVAGRTDNAMANILNAVENGLKYGAMGCLITDWGDNGHWQPLPVSYAGFAYGAATSWCLSRNRNLNLARVLDVHVFADDAGIMGRAALDLGNAYLHTGAPLGNQSILAALLLQPASELNKDKHWRKLSAAGLRRAQAHIAAVSAKLDKTAMAGPDAELVAAEFRQACAVLTHACRLGLARMRAGGVPADKLPRAVRTELAAELRPIIAEHRRLWLARNRSGGLADSAARFERLLDAYHA